MLKNKYALFICAAALMGSMLQAHAQRMYRCGNAYQDRPCEGAQPPGKELRDFSGSAAPANRPVADPQCARLGEEAVKIVWARESGATREQQIAANAQNQPLIDSVYYKRGSAPELRTAIEAECMAETQRESLRFLRRHPRGRLQTTSVASSSARTRRSLRIRRPSRRRAVLT